MNGYILLEGGAEFGGRMAEPDLRAIELAGGLEAPVRIIPTAAAPDHNDQRAGQNGVRWFQSLGAKDVKAVPLVDRASADSDLITAELRRARLIYMLGGFPGYLGKILSGSLSWQATQESFQEGAVIAGSSAGAMVLCQSFFSPETGEVIEGLNLVPKACVIPHHDTLGKNWRAKLPALLPGFTLIGIDEQTGVIDDGGEGRWTVYGKGGVTLYRDGKVWQFSRGEIWSVSDANK